MPQSTCINRNEKNLFEKKKFTMSNGLQTSYYQNNKIVCLAFRCQDFLEYVAFVPLGINIRAKETFR